MTRIAVGKVHVGMSADKPSRLTDFGRRCYAERIFMDSPSDNKLARVETAMRAGRIPFLSVKPGTWRTASSGGIDTPMRKLADTLAALSAEYDTDVVVTFHHEPLQTPSSPSGEGGSSSDWLAMWEHLIPVMRRPGLLFVPVMNGWCFRPRGQGGTQGLTEPQKQEWLPSRLRAVIDGLGSDQYEMTAGQNSPSVVMGLVQSWAAANGIKSLFIGEFGSPDGSGEIDKVRDVVLRAGTPWRVVCWWNSDRVGQFGLNGQRMVDMREFVAAAEAFNDDAAPPEDDPADIARITAAQTALDGPGTALARIDRAITALTTTEGA